MTDEQLAFLAVVFAMSTIPVLAGLIAARAMFRGAMREFRLAARRGRRQRHIRTVFTIPEPRRVAGFLSHLAPRDSEPPPSAFVFVRHAREVVVHRPAPSRQGREVVPPRCRGSR